MLATRGSLEFVLTGPSAIGLCFSEVQEPVFIELHRASEVHTGASQQVLGTRGFRSGERIWRAAVGQLAREQDAKSWRDFRTE